MILRRYLIRQVLTTTLLVLGFLVVMLLGGRLIRYFGLAAEGGLQVSLLYRLIGYNLPFFLELILPLSFFIGLMLVFGRLYADSEMAILNSAGISKNTLAKLLLPLVLVLLLCEFGLTLWGKPWGVASSENIWRQQSLAKVFDLIRPREFISSGEFHLYVGEIGQNREYLKDVIIIQSPKKDANTAQKDTVIVASLATQVPTDDSTVQLDLHNGRRYELDSQSRGYNEVGFERYRLSLEMREPVASTTRIESVPTAHLLGQDNNEAIAELGYRISLPFLIIFAVMLALPLSKTAPRQGRWARLVPAVFVFVAMVLILISLKNPIEKGKITVASYGVVLVVMLAGLILLNSIETLKLKRLAKA